VSVISYYTTIQILITRSSKREWKWSGLLKQEALFLLNMMNFIYAFVKSKNFIFIKCEELYLCFCWVNDLYCYCKELL